MSAKQVSSKLKQRQKQTKLLQSQTKQMQQRLAALKQQVKQQKKQKQTNGLQSTITKWKKITGDSSLLKGYANKVLADRKEALNKYGIDEKKIIGSKSFQFAIKKIRQEKLKIEGKDPTIIPKVQINNNKTEQYIRNDGKNNNIQKNLLKAKINTFEFTKRKSLQQFLQQNYLQQYLNILQTNNITNIEELSQITKQRMNEIGILAGHQMKMMKKVKQEMEGKEKNRNREKMEKLEEEMEKEGEKVSFGYGDGNVDEYQSIDLENKQQQQIYNNTSKQKFKFEREQILDQGQDNQLDEEQDQVIITLPEMVSFSIQANPIQESSTLLAGNQFNCFQCYKKCYHKPQQSSDGRLFCGSSCLNKYLQFMQKQCPQCHQFFYKFQGYFENGLWFCSIKCSPNHQKMQEMFISWSRKQNSMV